VTTKNVPKKTAKVPPRGWTIPKASAILQKSEHEIRRLLKTGDLQQISGGGRGKQIWIRPVDPVTFQSPRIPRGRPSRQGRVSDLDYATAQVKYLESEAQIAQTASAEDWRRLAGDLRLVYEHAIKDMTFTSQLIDAGKYEFSAKPTKPIILMRLAGQVESIAEALDRVATWMLSRHGIVAPQTSRADPADPIAQMQVAHVLELAGASASQIAQELGISIDSVKGLKKRWQLGAWRRLTATRILGDADDLAARRARARLRRTLDKAGGRRRG
jgi:hypothetical protein